MRSICLFLLWLLQLTGAVAQDWPGDAQTRISLRYLTVPLFTRTGLNACIEIRVFITMGTSVPLQQLDLSLNKEAVDGIARIELLAPDENSRQPLLSAKVVGVASFIAARTVVPLSASLKQGWNSFWVNVRLKEDADPDAHIALQVVGIQTKQGRLWKPAVGDQPVRYRTGMVLRQKGEDDVHTYRIPGITVTGKGTLFAVYDARYKNSGDLPGDIDVAVSRSVDGGRHWEPMRIIMDMGEPHENNGVGDPAILFDPVQSKIWVAALWSKGNRSIAGSQPGLSPDTTGQFVLVSSDDDGKTWTPPYSITPQVKNPAWHLYFNGPGNGIAMHDGTLVFASQYWDETTEPARVGIPYSSIVYSRDHGQTWQSGVGAKSNTTESQVVETRPGELMLNMRDNRGGFRSVATTRDMGKTWTEHISSRQLLADPVCMGGFTSASVEVQGKKKEALFFSNPASSLERSHITIKASTDAGESWPAKQQLLVDERVGYGYSALIAIDAKTLGFIYEGTGELYFLRIPVKDVLH